MPIMKTIPLPAFFEPMSSLQASQSETIEERTYDDNSKICRDIYAVICSRAEA